MMALALDLFRHSGDFLEGLSNDVATGDTGADLMKDSLVGDDWEGLMGKFLVLMDDNFLCEKCTSFLGEVAFKGDPPGQVILPNGGDRGCF